MRVPSEIAEARKAETGPSGKELTEKQKESKRKKKKALLAVSFFAFCMWRRGCCMHFRPRISSIWLSPVFAFFMAALGLCPDLAFASATFGEVTATASGSTPRHTQFGLRFPF
jgi:hypothetical protein